MVNQKKRRLNHNSNLLNWQQYRIVKIMLTPFTGTILSVLAVSAISLVGILTLSINEKLLRRGIFALVALAAGSLFGDALLHLIPEIFVAAAEPTTAALWILVGIVVLFGLEKFLHWDHHHELDQCVDCHHSHIQPLGKINLLADGLHNFLDGIAIAASFLASIPLGLATTLAVILHEIPQEIGDFGILLHAGYSKRQALWFNLLSALAAVLGALLVFALGTQLEAVQSILLPLAAGSFLYIAGSDLVPELHKTRDLKKSLVQAAAFISGIGLMYLLLLLE